MRLGVRIFVVALAVALIGCGGGDRQGTESHGFDTDRGTAAGLRHAEQDVIGYLRTVDPHRNIAAFDVRCEYMGTPGGFDCDAFYEGLRHSHYEVSLYPDGSAGVQPDGLGMSGPYDAKGEA